MSELADFPLGKALVRPPLRRIEGPAATVRVEPRVMQVLAILQQASGAVVSRDTLVRNCWGGVFVGEDSLNRAISQIRRALKQAGVEGVEIETVPRTGYRLTGSAPSGDSPSGPATPVPRMGRRQAIAAALGTAVLGAAGIGIWRARTDSTAQELAGLLEQSEEALREGTPAGNARAAHILGQALALRPGDARTWGKLALARAYLAEVAPPEQATATVAGVREAARRAFALDSGQIDAHAALAILPPYYGDWLAAERRMQQVLARDPEYLPMRDTYDFFKVATGRAREGSRDRLVIAAREPFHAVHQFKKIYSLWILGRIEEADRAADRALRLWPRHPAVWLSRLWTLAFTGRAARALAHALDAAVRPDFPPWMIETVVASMRALETRRPADIAEATRRNLADLHQGPSQSVSAILHLAGLGQIDHAFDVAHAYLLERGPLMAALRWRPGQLAINDLQQRSTHMLFIPSTAALRADPRFMPLCRDIGLLDYWQEAGIRPDFLGAAPLAAQL